VNVNHDPKRKQARRNERLLQIHFQEQWVPRNF